MVHLHRVVVGLLISLACGIAFAYSCTQYQASGCNGACAGSWSTDKLTSVLALQESLNTSTTQIYCNGRMSGTNAWIMDFANRNGVGGACGSFVEGVGGYHANTGGFNTRTGDNCTDPTCTGFGVRVNTTTHTCEVTRNGWCADKSIVDATAGTWNAQVDTTTAQGPAGSGTYCVPTPGSPFSDLGCTANFSRDISYQTSTGWHSEGRGSTAYDPFASPTPTYSTSCASSTTTTVAPDTCPGGQPGTVNGVTVCIPYPSDTPKTTESTSKGTTTTASPGGTVSTPSQSVSSTSCGADGNCTTTTTTTTGDTTTTSSSTQSKDQFCRANPTDKQCDGSGAGGTGSGSKFWGACSGSGGFGTFDCQGDAALCAAAKAINEIDCALRFDGTATEVAKYETAKASPSTTGLGSETTSISSSSFDQSNALGGSASCIADRTITVSLKNISKTIVVPFSLICSQLGPMGNILLAVSFLTGMMIVFRRTS